MRAITTRAITTAAIATACAGAVALTPQLLEPTRASGTVAGPAFRSAAGHPSRRPAAHGVPGRTHTLPLTRLPSTRAVGRRDVAGVPARTVAPFSLLGLTWNDPAARLAGTVEVRTRSASGHRWSPWRPVQVNDDDAPDERSPDRATGHLRGATAPLWTGPADGVQVRALSAALPAGLRLDMIDPGPDAADEDEADDVLPADADDPADGDDWSDEEWSDDDTYVTDDEAAAEAEAEEDAEAESRAGEADPGGRPAHGHKPRRQRPRGHRAPRPAITTRRGWGADERLRKGGYLYTSGIRAVFVHHSDTGNGYRCSQVPSIIRGIYRYHVRSLGWRDIGYNFLIDKCGRIYEGRAGGITKAVMGAHTLGFNAHTMGVALLGDYQRTRPPTAALRALERLAAWKLGLTGRDPRGTAALTSSGNGRYRRGAHPRFHAISGHRDGYPTECPGSRLYALLPQIRQAAARLQHR